MNIRSAPTSIDKLALLGDATRYEPAGVSPRTEQHALDTDGLLSCISHVTTPSGPKPVLKAMVTTACENNCNYCPFRAGRDKMRRMSFTPDELAHAFDQLRRAGVVDGIFLSSGMVSGLGVQDKIIATAEILRAKYAYDGYIHLKVMPGAEYDQVRRTMQLADRVSVNLEAPTQARLHALAPKKDFNDALLQRLRWTHEIRRRAPHSIRASATTQFVVGAVGDTDLELLSLSAQLYKTAKLARAYYSRFNPVEETPFEGLMPTSHVREHRLYQASFLLRDYQWDVEDLPFVDDGNLRLDIDPKRAWADLHLRHAPIELMNASRAELLRVPGIGPHGADVIIKARRRGRLTDLSHLHAIGIRAVGRVAPYILLGGRRPPEQLTLWD